jgi:hypothetical protein
MGAQAIASFVHPPTQSRPRLDQGLVRELHGVLVQREQPGPGQLLDDQRGVRLLVRVQLRPGGGTDPKCS